MEVDMEVDMSKDIIIKHFLNKCNIHFEEYFELDNLLIDRDILLNDYTYKNVKPDIVILKNILSSCSLNCLHKNAYENQRWPLLNLVRQLLKVQNFMMKPIRKSNGYDKSGKKKYKRFFFNTENKKK